MWRLRKVVNGVFLVGQASAEVRYGSDRFVVASKRATVCCKQG